MMLATRNEQRRERLEDSRLSLMILSLAAGSITVTVILLSLYHAAASARALPSVVTIVDTGANGLLIFCLLTVCLLVLEHAILATRWSLEDVCRLALFHLLSAARVPPTHIARPASEALWFLLAARFRAAQLARCLIATQASLRPPSKAPFRLFRQAPLLVSP